MNSLCQQLDSYNSWGLERFENRWMLSAPTLGTDLTDYVVNSTGSFTIPVDGYDAAGHRLTIDARFLDNPNFDVQVVQGSTFAKLYFKTPQIWQGVVGATPQLDETYTLSVTLPGGSETATASYTVVSGSLTASGLATALATAWNTDARPDLSVNVFAYADGANVYLIATSEFEAVADGTGEWTRREVVQEAVEGAILVELFTGRPWGQAAAERFITLATNAVNANGTLNPDGTPFYTDVQVHRIIKDFMLQCGDATMGNGSGNSPLPNLFDAGDPFLSFASRGLMAFGKQSTMLGDTIPNTSNGQWFILDGASPHLDHTYTIFGQMINGWDLFDVMMQTPMRGTTDSPVATPFLTKIEILEPDDVEATQAFTLIVTPKNGYAGTGTLEITLTDEFGVSSTHLVTVTACGIAPITTVEMAPGERTTIPVSAVVDLARNATISVINVGLSSANVSYADGDLTIHVPGGFTGTFTITLRAVLNYDNPDDGKPSYVDYTFFVISATPYDPDYLRTLPLEFGMLPENTFIAGNRLYVACGESGVKIYDISVPDNPVFISLIVTPGHAWDVQVVGDIMYVTDIGVITGFNWMYGQYTYSAGRFEAWDVSDLDNVTMLSSVTMPNANILPFGFTVRDGYAYVAEYGRGMSVYDVSNPSSIVWKATMYTDVTQQIDLRYVLDVVVDGNYAYVSDYSYGLIIVYDITTPASPKYKDYSYNPNPGTRPWGLAIDGNTLYSGDLNLGLVVYDLPRNGGAPVYLGYQAMIQSWESIGAANIRLAEMTVDGQVRKYALVPTMSGTAFVDVTDRRRLQISYMAGSGTPGLTPAVNGDLAYLMTAGGMVVMDMTGLQNFTLVKTATFTSNGVQVTVRVTGDGGVIVPTEGAIDPTRLAINGSYNTVVTITTSGGIWMADSITVYGEIRSFTATTTQSSAFYFNGLGTLTLGNLNVPGGTVIDLGWGFAATAVTLGDVTNLKLTTDGALRSLAVNSWNASNDHENLLWAQACQSITSKGNFVPDVTLAGGGTLATVSINGSVIGSTWRINSYVTNLTIKGLVKDWEFSSWSLVKGSLGVVEGVTNLSIGYYDATGKKYHGIGSLEVASWEAGILYTWNVDKLTVKGFMGASLEATATAAQLAGNVAANQKAPAAIGTVSVGSWGSGEIKGYNLTSLEVKGAMAGDVTLLDAVGKVSVGSWDAGSLTAGSLTSLAVKGAMNGSLTIYGAAGQISADSWGTGDLTAGSVASLTLKGAMNGNMTVTGSAGKVSVGSWGAGELKADSLISLTVKDAMNGAVTVTNSAGQVSAGSWGTGELSAGSVTSFAVKGAMGGSVTVAGAVGKVSAGSWNGGELKADSLTSLTIQGVMNGNVTVTHSAGQISVGSWTAGLLDAGSLTSLTVKEAMNGGMAIAGSVGKVSAGSWGPGALTAGSLTSLAIKGAMNGSMTVFGAAGQISADSWGTGALTAGSVTSLTLKNAMNGSVTVTGAGGRISVGSWNGGVLQADSLTSLAIKESMLGNVFVTNAAGQISAGSWLGGALNAGSVTSLEVKGAMNGSMTVAGAGGKVSVGSWGPGALNAGSLNSLAVKGAMDGSVTVANAAGQISADSWNGGTLTAGSLTSLAVKNAMNGNVAVAGAGGKVSAGSWTGDLTTDSLNSLEVKGVMNGNVTVTNAAGQVSVGSWTAGTLAAASLNSLNVKDAMDGSMTIAGSGGKVSTGSWGAGTLDVGSLTSLAVKGAMNGSLTVANAAGQISADSWGAGALTAGSLTSLTLKGAMNGTMTVTGAGGRISTGSWNGGALQADSLTSLAVKETMNGNVTVTHSAGQVSVGSWTAGDFNAGSLTSLEVKGAMGGSLTVAGAGGKVSAGSWGSGELQAASLTSFAVKGAMNGRLTVANAVGQVSADSWNGGAITADSLIALTVKNAMNGNLTVTNTVGQVSVGSWVSGDVTARSIAKLSAKGDVGVNLTITGDASAANLPSVAVGDIIGGAWMIAGNTGTVSAASIAAWTASFDTVKTISTSKGDVAGMTLTADKLDTLTVKGDLANSAITLTLLPNVSDPRQLTLNKFTVGGTMQNTALESAGHIGNVTVGAFLGSRVTAGLAAGKTHAEAMADFASQARIDAFTIQGIKTLPVAFDGWVSAHTLGKVALVNADPAAGASFGLSAVEMTNYSYKHDANKTSVSWNNKQPTWPESVNNFKILHIV